MCRTRANATYGIGTFTKAKCGINEASFSAESSYSTNTRMTGELMKQVAELTKGAE